MKNYLIGSIDKEKKLDNHKIEECHIVSGENEHDAMEKYISTYRYLIGSKKFYAVIVGEFNKVDFTLSDRVSIVDLINPYIVENEIKNTDNDNSDNCLTPIEHYIESGSARKSLILEKKKSFTPISDFIAQSEKVPPIMGNERYPSAEYTPVSENKKNTGKTFKISLKIFDFQKEKCYDVATKIISGANNEEDAWKEYLDTFHNNNDAVFIQKLVDFGLIAKQITNVIKEDDYDNKDDVNFPTEEKIQTFSDSIYERCKNFKSNPSNETKKTYKPCVSTPDDNTVLSSYTVITKFFGYPMTERTVRAKSKLDAIKRFVEKYPEHLSVFRIDLDYILNLIDEVEKHCDGDAMYELEKYFNVCKLAYFICAIKVNTVRDLLLEKYGIKGDKFDNYNYQMVAAINRTDAHNKYILNNSRLISILNIPHVRVYSAEDIKGSNLEPHIEKLIGEGMVNYVD